MTAIPGIALGPIAGMLLRFPKTAAALHSSGAFIKAHWKGIAITVGVVAACVSAYAYVKHVEKVSYASGMTAAQVQYKAAVDHANKIAADDQHKLDLLKVKYDDLSNARQTQVVTVTKPIIERITREVQGSTVYRSCTLTDGVFNDLQAEAAGVNASINSSKR